MNLALPLAQQRALFEYMYADRQMQWRDISDALGVGKGTLIRWRVKLGLPTRTSVRDERHADLRAQFNRLYAETHMGAKAIADQLGIPRSVAARWRRATGLPVKPVSNGAGSRPAPARGRRNVWTGYWAQCEAERDRLIAIDDSWAKHPLVLRERILVRARATAKRIYEERKHDPAWMAARKAAHQRWCKANPEKRTAGTKKWAEQHPDRIKELRRRSRRDPYRKMIMNLRRRLREIVHRRVGTATLKLIGCSTGFFRQYIAARFTPGMAWDNYGSVWHIDHIKPCALFDLRSPAQRRRCFHYTNLQPLFAADNIAKSDKVLRQAEFLS